MTSEYQRQSKYYVVGGAIQPGRDCYVQRVADAELFRRASEGEYCHVLAQPQAGKTSLAASTAARLRAQGIGVAVVDLDRISKEDLSENAGRWYYSIVYRVARDLRIKVDLQSWWAERGGLTDRQRLREFFLEIVLQETEQPVVVFFDRLEVTRGEPLAQDLFAAIRACYDARATTADANRLAFVLLASASADELVRELQGSAFEISAAIDLDDFSPQEMAGLVNGLGETYADPEALISRVWNWTRGHPYLSQKVFRGLARRADADISVADVDDLVRRQFSVPTALHDEPHLSAIAERLLRAGPRRTARLNLYGRVRKGVEVAFDPASEIQHELLTTGIVTVGQSGELRVRNEIYATVFSTRWANQNLPFGSRGIIVAAAVLALLIALPVWYVEYLPQPYVKALIVANQDFELAEDAYERLSSLPGQGSTADRLFSDFLVRSSRSAESLPEVISINSRLQLLPGGTASGASLLAEYWERQALLRMHEGDRDSAFVAALEALQQPTDRRRRLAAELIGSDYRKLWATLHARAPISAVRADQENNLVTVLDRQNYVDVWRLGPGQPEHLRGLRLIAEERLQIEQRRTYAQFPVAPRLLIRLSHAQPAQVQVVLRSPSGQSAALMLDRAALLQKNIFAFDFALYPQLRQLLDDELAGNWTLLVSDLERGAEGELSGWGVVEKSVAALDGDQLPPRPIPAPRTSVNAMSRISDDGRMAMSWPANPDTAGPLLIWDVVADAVVARIPRGADMRAAQFAMQGTRVVVVRAQVVEVWDSASGRKLGQFQPATRGQPRLQLSRNGRFAAMLVQQRNGDAGVAVWDLRSLRRIALIGAADATETLVDSTGRYLATGGRDSWVRVWSLNDGSLLHEFATSAPVRKLDFDPLGAWLSVDDLSNTIRVWSLTGGDQPVIERIGSSPWYSAFAADSGRLIVGSPDRSYQIFELPEGRKTEMRLRHTAAFPFSRENQQDPMLLAGLNIAVTTAGEGNIKLWRLSAGLSAKIPARTVPADMRTALSPDGYLIAAGSSSDELRVYVAGAPGGMRLQPPESATANNSEILRLEFSADRNLLAAGTIEGEIHVWDVRRGVLRGSRIVHADGAVQDLLFNAAGKLLFSASGREVLVTQVDTGVTLARLGIQANNPQLAYAEQSGELFVAGDEGGVTQWNWRNGISKMLVAGARDVTRVAVTPAGNRLVTADARGQLTVWHVDRGVALQQTVQAAARIDNLWLVDDGRRLIVQAGHWLHALALKPAGLAAGFTRLLGDTPSALQPDEFGRIISVLSPATARPKVLRIAVTEPPADLFLDDPATARTRWQRLLSMSLDPVGQVVRVMPESADEPAY